MGDYISRDMAIARMTKLEVTNRLATMTGAKREIADMPVADVVPVVHGQWIDNELNGYKWAFICSKCGYIDGYPFSSRHNFCPNCGAKMDGGADNETD